MEHNTKNAHLEEQVTTTQEKLAEFIKKNIYDIAIVLICVVYMFQGIAQVEKTGDSLIVIFGKCFINLIFSLTLCRLLESRGMMVGGDSAEYKDAIAKYNKAVEEAGPFITELDAWCDAYNKAEHERQVTLMLYQLGVSYQQYVDNEINTSNFTKEQLKKLAKVRKYKVPTITTAQLMSGDIDSEKQMDYTKITKKKYIEKSTITDMTTKVLLIAILGYFTLSPFNTWDWSGFIWSAFQAVLALGLSVLKYFDAYGFMTGDMTAKIIDKKNKLNLFIQEKGDKNNVEND